MKQRRRRRNKLLIVCLYTAISVYIGFVLNLLGRSVAMEAFGPVSVTRRAEKYVILNLTKPKFGNGPFELYIPDIGSDYFPFWQVPEVLDFWVLVGVFITATRFFLSEMGYTVLRRWVFCFGTMELVRGIASSLTSYPLPTSNCPVEYLKTDRVLVTAFLVFTRQTSTCSDTLLSVHGINMTLVVLVWVYYYQISRTIAGVAVDDWVNTTLSRVFLVFYAIVGFVLLMANRVHYSENVFLNSLTTILVWVSYHQVIEVFTLRDAANVTPSNTWIRRVIAWLENDAEDLENLAMEVTIQVSRTPGLNKKRSTNASTVENSSDDDSDFEDAFKQPNLPLWDTSKPVIVRGYESFGLPRD